MYGEHYLLLIPSITNSNVIAMLHYYRLQLAALHFNENSSRSQAVTKQGTRRYDVVYPKYKKGGYVVKKILENATYGWKCNEACQHTSSFCL